jgi:VIT1/CCC1 family predicted Fe2+/Mn2+ transporter
LGALTAIVDYFVHPGMFGPAALEAIVTGLGAALLSYLVGTMLRVWRLRRDIASKLL